MRRFSCEHGICTQKAASELLVKKVLTFVCNCDKMCIRDSINDALFAFPSILLALVFVTLLGGGTWNVIIALGIAFIPSFARIVRGEFIRCKNMDYVRSCLLYTSYFLLRPAAHIS